MFFTFYSNLQYNKKQINYIRNHGEMHFACIYITMNILLANRKFLTQAFLWVHLSSLNLKVFQ